MAKLPLRSPDVSQEEGGEPRVVGVDDEDADDLLGVLSSDTARDVLSAVHDDPAPPSDIADRLDTSLQSVHYHLENLEEAGVVEVADTIYSEKGREMKVYAPAHGPIVVFAGPEEESNDLRDALSKFVSGLGLLAVASLLVQQLFGDGVGALVGAGDAPTPTPTPATNDVMIASNEATPTAVPAAGDVAATAPPEPGLVFFAGGLLVLLVAVAVATRR